MAEPALASRAQAALSACQAELWAFTSADRALRGMEISSLASLDGIRPSSRPGFSVIVRAGWSGHLAIAAWYLRDLSPLLPLAAVTPRPQDTFELDITRFCDGLGIRLLHDDLAQDDLARVGELLRTERVDPRLDFLNFLRRRGHRLEAAPELKDLLGTICEAGTLRHLGPAEPSARRRCLNHWRYLLRVAGLPSLRAFTTAVRLVLAGIELYSDRKRGMAEVAARFGFSNQFEMSNLMLRYLGERPSRVRELYPWEWMFDRALPNMQVSPELRWRWVAMPDDLSRSS